MLPVLTEAMLAADALGLFTAVSARRESNRTPPFGSEHNVG
jgi:hypothetical protein